MCTYQHLHANRPITSACAGSWVTTYCTRTHIAQSARAFHRDIESNAMRPSLPFISLVLATKTSIIARFLNITTLLYRRLNSRGSGRSPDDGHYVVLGGVSCVHACRTCIEFCDVGIRYGSATARLIMSLNAWAASVSGGTCSCARACPAIANAVVGIERARSSITQNKLPSPHTPTVSQ